MSVNPNAKIPQDEWNRIRCVQRAAPSSSCFSDQYRSREVSSAQTAEAEHRGQVERPAS